MFNIKELDRIIKNQLASYKFKCAASGCDELFMHGDAFAHAEKCLSEPATLCLLKCGSANYFKG